jgi:hypothetical protein
MQPSIPVIPGIEAKCVRARSRFDRETTVATTEHQRAPTPVRQLGRRDIAGHAMLKYR